MSEIYKKRAQTEITVIEIMIITVWALISAPILPLNILFGFLTLRTERKENYGLYPSVAIIALLCGKIGLFAEETARVAVELVRVLIYGNTAAILAYGHYSVTSWVLLAAVSFVVSAFVVKRIRYNRKLEEVGISSLERKHRKDDKKQYE